MRILIYALGAVMGGAMRHLTNFLPELGRSDGEREYVIVVRESFAEPALEANIRLARVPDRASAGWLSRLYADAVALPQQLRRGEFGAVVSLTNFGPIWSPVPHIFFQRNPLYYCHYYLSQIGAALRAETMLRRRLAVASMQRADLIVTPSDGMAAMIRETCPQVRDRPFRTVYHGFSPETLQDALEDRFARLLDRGGPLLLYPTHPARHKGFEVLFQALAQLKQRLPGFTLLTTIARDDWPSGVSAYERTIAALGLQDHVVLMGRVPQRQMGALYNRCDLMVYPSLCESFGFSMIEAMGNGLPIVAAGTVVNREICAGGALYYPPLDATAAAAAIEAALVPGTADRLRGQGRARVDSFDWSWRRYAGDFVRLLEAVGC